MSPAAPTGANVPENYRFRWLDFVSSDQGITFTDFGGSVTDA
jgi:hypothetical protein